MLASHRAAAACLSSPLPLDDTHDRTSDLLPIVTCSAFLVAIVQGMVLLASTLKPCTAWEFTTLLVLLSGHWPPRGLISGRWPPGTVASDDVDGEVDSNDDGTDAVAGDVVRPGGSATGNSSDGGSGTRSQRERTSIPMRKTV